MFRHAWSEKLAAHANSVTEEVLSKVNRLFILPKPLQGKVDTGQILSTLLLAVVLTTCPMGLGKAAHASDSTMITK